MSVNKFASVHICMGVTYRHSGHSYSLEMDKERPFFFIPTPEGVRGEINNFTNMKKIFTFFIAALMSASIFAAKDVIPTDVVLADYYNQGDVCVCFYVPAEMNCNNIVLTGSFNDWSSTISECPTFEPVEGYDGWYVGSFEPEAEPDATNGIQAKPVMLDEDGNFNWAYQIGDATAIRGGVQVVQGSFAGEINLINYGTDAPNVFQLNSWKENPCTAIYHNYTITVISDGCEGKAVPFIIGGMNNWTFTQMLLDNAKTAEYGVPTYYASFKAAEGTPYQILSGIIDPQTGDIEIQPYWNDDSYMQKLVDDLWVRIPGVQGDNQLTHEEATITWDLRAEDLRWARCAPAEPAEYTVIAVNLPALNCPEAVEIIGTFDDWAGTAMEKQNTGWYFVELEAKASQYFKFRGAGSWDQEIEVYDAENAEWRTINDNEFIFDQLWQDDSYRGTPCKWIELDMSNPTMYRWSGAEQSAEQTEYTYVTIKVPSCSSEAPVLVGSFNNWDLATAIPMTLTNDYTYTCSVLASADDEFKVAGSINGWENQIAVYNETTGLWEDAPNNRIGEQTEVFVDYSDNTKYKWSFCEDIVTTKTYDFEKDGCYYNVLSLSDLTVQLTCRGDETNPDNNAIATYSGDFRVPETVEFSGRTFTVKSIHPLAFINCNLGTLTIPASITEIVYNIYNEGYGTCRNLIVEDSEEYIYNEGGRIIGTIYDSVYIGRDFSNLTHGALTYHALYHAISFGNKVTSLGPISSPNISNINLPSNIKSLYGTFKGCPNLKSVSGEGVESIRDAFCQSGIKNVYFPNLKTMYNDFQYCDSLKSLILPEGLIIFGGGDGKFGGECFGSKNLEYVYIPSTVTSFTHYSFSYCTSLNTIAVANPNPIMINEDNFDLQTYFNATLKVPVGCKTKYENAPVWSNFLNIVEDPSLVATYATVVVSTDYIYDGSVNYAFSEEGSIYQGYNIVPVGCTMTITVQPDENYLLSSLTVNGEDVTANVVNNEYSIVINGSATYSINAQFEYNYTPGPQGEYVSIVYVDKDSEYIDSQSVTLYLPEAPEIEGFTFVGWQPVAAIIEGAITIQAVYEYNGSTSGAPEVVTNPKNKAQKLIREGNVYVLYGDKTYTLTGQEVR